MVWCGGVWCGVVWYGVVWCDVVWCVVWCGVVWCGVVWFGVVWCHHYEIVNHYEKNLINETSDSHRKTNQQTTNYNGVPEMH